MPDTTAIANPEDIVMTFGKYKGQTLGEIASIDLLYIDWLSDLGIYDTQVKRAVDHICTDRHREIANLIDKREGRRR